VAQPEKKPAYWGTSHSVAVGAVVLVAGIVILAQGQLIGLAVLAFALFYGGFAVFQYRRGRL
jgi:dipeptide/tripeptide permease